jgi:hypothetical protein
MLDMELVRPVGRISGDFGRVYNPFAFDESKGNQTPRNRIDCGKSHLLGRVFPAHIGEVYERSAPKQQKARNQDQMMLVLLIERGSIPPMADGPLLAGQGASLDASEKPLEGCSDGGRQRAHIYTHRQGDGTIISD